jgi:hypothetical protein
MTCAIQTMISRSSHLLKYTEQQPQRPANAKSLGVCCYWGKQTPFTWLRDPTPKTLRGQTSMKETSFSSFCSFHLLFSLICSSRACCNKTILLGVRYISTAYEETVGKKRCIVGQLTSYVRRE